MAEAPETRESLLIRLSDPSDRDAWDTFVSIYRPLVYRIARLRGVQDADAQDLAQRVLLSVSKSISDWTPRPGSRFRHWIARIAKNAAINALQRQPRDRARGGSGYAAALGSVEQQSIEQLYELEYRRQVYRRAAEIVRNRADEKTWLAFSLTMVDGLSVDQVAERLAMPPGSVYAARSRMVRRLRDQVQILQDQSENRSPRQVGDARHEA
ncbi:MAG: sigma-70 family RNA polymerase sigma factor [Planctomycetota bacterium]